MEVREGTTIDVTSAPETIKKRLLRELNGLEQRGAAIASDESQTEENELKQLITYSGLRTVEMLIERQRQMAE